MRFTFISIGSLFLLLATSVYGIGAGTVELGLDVSAGYTTHDSWHLFQLQAPSQLRLDCFVTRNLAMDVRLATTVASTNYGSASHTSLVWGLAPHFGTSSGSILGFFEGFVSFDIVAGDGSGSQAGIGGSIGMKGHGKPFNPRFELMVLRRLPNNDYLGLTTFQLNVGISFFSK